MVPRKTANELKPETLDWVYRHNNERDGFAGDVPPAESEEEFVLKPAGKRTGR